MEGGGKTLWVDPKELCERGFSMLLYPTTLLFCLTRAIQDLKAHRPMPAEETVTFHDFEQILELQYWAEIRIGFYTIPKCDWNCLRNRLEYGRSELTKPLLLYAGRST